MIVYQIIGSLEWSISFHIGQWPGIVCCAEQWTHRYSSSCYQHAAYALSATSPFSFVCEGINSHRQNTQETVQQGTRTAECDSHIYVHVHQSMHARGTLKKAMPSFPSIPALWVQLGKDFVSNYEAYSGKIKNPSPHERGLMHQQRVTAKDGEVLFMRACAALPTIFDMLFTKKTCQEGYTMGEAYADVVDLASQIARENGCQRVQDLRQFMSYQDEDKSAEPILIARLHLWAKENEGYFTTIAVSSWVDLQTGGHQSVQLFLYRTPYDEAAVHMRDFTIRKGWEKDWIDCLRGVPGLQGIVQAYDRTMCKGCGKPLRQVSRFV